MNEIEYTFYDAEDDEMVAVIEYEYVAGRPANTSYGHPDNYSPAEPSEIDLGKITVAGRELGREEAIKFLDQHEESIYDAIEKQQSEGREE